MMNNEELKNFIIKLIRDYVAEYPKSLGISSLWNEPLVAFASAYDPYIQSLPQIITPEHKLPQDFMENPKAVIVYFLPFKAEVALTNANVPDNTASPQWAEAYKITNTMIPKLNRALSEKICELAYRAIAPDNVGMLPDILMSNWSQRHLAYAAGLGTFGINNMLITEKGCCGRYGSIVADVPVATSSALKYENCLYKRKGICQKCVRNCFSGALSVNGFDRKKCFAACFRNKELYGAGVCGKCDVDIPCAFSAPK